MITGWSFIIVVAYSLEGGVRISWSLARFSIFPQIVLFCTHIGYQNKPLKLWSLHAPEKGRLLIFPDHGFMVSLRSKLV